MQQTYTDAFLDLHRFESGGEGSFPAWLTSLAKCNLADALKMLEARKLGNGRRPITLGAHQDSFVALYELLAFMLLPADGRVNNHCRQRGQLLQIGQGDSDPPPTSRHINQNRMDQGRASPSFGDGPITLVCRRSSSIDRFNKFVVCTPRRRLSGRLRQRALHISHRSKSGPSFADRKEAVGEMRRWRPANAFRSAPFP